MEYYSGFCKFMELFTAGHVEMYLYAPEIKYPADGLPDSTRGE